MEMVENIALSKLHYLLRAVNLLNDMCQATSQYEMASKASSLAPYSAPVNLLASWTTS